MAKQKEYTNLGKCGIEKTSAKATSVDTFEVEEWFVEKEEIVV